MTTQKKAPVQCPILTRPAGCISEELATLQEEFGRLTAEATRSISDGVLTYLERSAIVIRLKGIQRTAADLLEALR